DHVPLRRRPGSSGPVTDAQLLERFLRQRDETAFELLMWRHSPLVLGVCRRVLHHTEDAEDASQATFLMLARKAGTISRRESVSGWLCMVAYRMALRAKMQAVKRSRRQWPLEEVADKEPDGDPADRMVYRELRRLLDAELSRMPEKYRTAFILC